MSKKIMYLAILVLSFAVCYAAPVYALTQDDVVKLVELEIPEDVIIQKIQASGTTFTLGAENEAALISKGVSKRIISAMKGATAGEPQVTTVREEAETLSNLLIILDSSGSMDEKTRDGQEKLSAAKQALTGLLDTLPNQLNVGLLCYGHRRKGDCSDIAIEVPVQPLDRAQIRGSVTSLKPLGTTPIAASLEEAGKHLSTIKGKSSIVLISDGEETCNGDPVAVAASLAQKYGIRVIVDVVGFDVNDKERAQLEAIARAGGGKYYSASTSGDLVRAVDVAVKERVVIKKAVKAGLGALTIDASAIKWLQGFVGDIYEQDTGKEVRDIYLTNTWYENSPPYMLKVKLKPGIYKLVFTDKNYPVTIDNVEVKPGEENVINLEE
ncbi:MAG: VWA domain-containing protein [Candidatus Omnitrophica bacterium]|nr:VWA domain-containing protein [Candidatus Omnitrophota bacterium]